MASSYDEHKTEIKAEQADLPYEDVLQEMQKKSKFALELDNLRPQEHHWVDRGNHKSCEGGMHPHHKAFKRMK